MKSSATKQLPQRPRRRMPPQKSRSIESATPVAAPSQRWTLAGIPIFPATSPEFPRIVTEHDPREREALHAEALGRPRMPLPARRPTFAPAAPRASWLPSGPGVPLEAVVREPAERQLGADLSRVRVHADDEARTVAGLLGARAFTVGSHVYLGPGTRVGDRQLLAHELQHALQANGDEVCLRSATWLERRAWLSFFDHYLPRKFLNNYMDDTGTPITLTQQEMIDCNPIVDLHRSTAFVAEVASLKKAGGGSKTIKVSGWGGALTNGTLGNFTIHYSGTVNVTGSGDWDFKGQMDFYDYWDFDPKPFGKGSGRPIPAEVKVRVANLALPGQPFDIKSVSVPVSQKSADSSATWAGGAPVHVGDKAGRTGADIGTGAEVGAGGGAPGDVAGGEVGAQSSEDLNKNKK